MDLKPVTGELLYGDDLRQPRKFSWLLLWGKPRLLSAAKENGEGARLPHVKSLKKTRAEVLSEKKYPLPVNGLHSGPRVHKNIYSNFRFQISMPKYKMNKV